MIGRLGGLLSKRDNANDTISENVQRTSSGREFLSRVKRGVTQSLSQSGIKTSSDTKQARDTRQSSGSARQSSGSTNPSDRADQADGEVDWKAKYIQQKEISEDLKQENMDLIMAFTQFQGKAGDERADEIQQQLNRTKEELALVKCEYVQALSDMEAVNMRLAQFATETNRVTTGFNQAQDTSSRLQDEVTQVTMENQTLLERLALKQLELKEMAEELRKAKSMEEHWGNAFRHLLRLASSGTMELAGPQLTC